MIIGIGTDLCDIRRIEKTLARFSDRFIQRIFTEAEQVRAERYTHSRAASYAKRFAAKEAGSKALGLGLIKSPLLWRELEVINLPSGAPSLRLHGNALSALEQRIPPGKTSHIHLSLTDDLPYAQAFVVIEAV